MNERKGTMSNLDGKIILITGAAKGMGATEAKMAVERGATVILSDIIEAVSYTHLTLPTIYSV